ncbi:transposase [Frankia sp. Mgl5]|uniref:RNA-guided endonuclease InsQ/TnpB family protein n=1 Tax=Frankia sp. Mgl5 TaxID=2933793 RepID=UPI00200E245A|nr:transposase [Frankia sp. Mgl5]MCK9926458.1 transposase [Frankia sp. Mgl5]
MGVELGGGDPGGLVDLTGVGEHPEKPLVVDDGRYYVSFVVDIDDVPYPATGAEIGIDLGVDRLATLSTGQIVANPRPLRSRQRRLARAQRALARKRKGSANRRKAVRRVAVEHRKVRETRRDHHHKLAARLVRDNQAVYVEDLAVVGLARTRLARSVHDAGWSMMVGLLEEKAVRRGRVVVRVGRFFPSSRICSACCHRDGPKPLKVRTWICPGCGVSHDRNLNAARNILVEGQRMVAAGRKGVAAGSADVSVVVTEVTPGYWAWGCLLHAGRGAECFSSRESAEWDTYCSGHDHPDWARGSGPCPVGDGRVGMLGLRAPVGIWGSELVQDPPGRLGVAVEAATRTPGEIRGGLSDR